MLFDPRALHSLAGKRAGPPAGRPSAAKPAHSAKPAAQRKRAPRRRVSRQAKPGRYDHLQPADSSTPHGNAETIEDAPITDAQAASIAQRILANAERGRPSVTRSGGSPIQVRRG